MIKLKNRQKSALILTLFISLAIFVNLNTLEFANEDTLHAKNDTTRQEDDFSIRPHASATKRWTMIVYNAADNNLDGTNNLPDGIGSDDDLNVVYLDDGASIGDTQACYITYNGDPEDIPLSDINSDWTNEVNTGDPDTLISFSKFCIDNYPADQYLVILRNHGIAYLGCCSDLSGGEEYENLDLDDLEVAFSAITSHLGHNIDVLHFDACLMSNMEVTAQLYPYVDYIVGAETGAYMSTWDNGEKIIEEIREDHFYNDSKGLAIRIADIAYCYDVPSRPAISISVIDCARVEDLIYDMNLLAIELIKKLSIYRKEIKDIRSILHSFFLPKLVDLYDFCEKLRENSSLIPDVIIRDYALNVMSDIEAVVIKEIHTISTTFCHGLSIYFPEFIYERSPIYHEISSARQGYLYFCTATMWGEFIDYFITGDIPELWAHFTCETLQYEDSNYDFTFNGFEGNGPATFSWDFGDGFTSSEINPIHIYDNPGNYTVILTIEDGDGDIDTYSVDIEVVENLNPTAQFTASNTLINVGDSVSFTFTGDRGVDSMRFYWGDDTSCLSEEENFTHMFDTPGIYSVYLIVEDGDHITDFLRKEDFIIVNDMPIITQPEDISFVVGSTGNVISWTVNDMISDNYEYTVYIKGGQYGIGQLYERENLTPGEPIDIDIDKLEIGNYSLSIQYFDGYNSVIWDEVIVEVKPVMPATPYMIAAMIVALVGVGIIINKKVKR